MNRRLLALLTALILCGCLAGATALGSATDAQGAIPTEEDTTFEAYAQQLFPGRALTEAETEAAQALYAFSLEIDEFEARVGAADTSDLKLVRDLLREEELMEDRLDAYEDTLEASYRANAFDRDGYLILDDELERLDERLDRIEDAMEHYWDD